MAWTQAEIDALKAAIGAGVKRVAYSDHTVEYHTLQEMMAALAIMETVVDSGANVAGAATTGRSTVASFRRD